MWSRVAIRERGYETNPIMPLVAGLMLGLTQTAFAADGLDVTMQVLDDVSGIDGVLLSVDDSAETGDRGADHADGRASEGADHRPADGQEDGALDGADEARHGPDNDLDEHAEGGGQDSNVPHDPATDTVPADGGPAGGAL